MAALLNNAYSSCYDKLTIIDCRFAYEYIGGHIQGATNMDTQEAVMKHFFPNGIDQFEQSDQRHIVIFHCEFSSHRGPKM